MLLGMSPASWLIPLHAIFLPTAFVYYAGVAAGATRAALTLHFAKQNNAADIAAKEGTQVYCHGTHACDAYKGTCHDRYPQATSDLIKF